VIIVFLLQIIIVGAQAPYEISISPTSIEIEKSDPIIYNVEITADPGFEDPINIVLEVSVLTETRYFELGTAYPPYPQVFPLNITVPEEVPAGVTIEGKIVATSGGMVVEENVQVIIKGGSIITRILSMFLNIFNSIIRTIKELL
jgi:hypothetical protein